MLEAALLAYAAWTLVYHVCLIARLGVGWGLAGWAAVLVAGGVWWARRRGVGGRTAAGDGGDVAMAPAPVTPRAVALAGAVAAVAAAALAAFADPPWALVWGLWLVAAGAGVAAGATAAAGAALHLRPRPRLEAAVTAGWAFAMAAGALLVRNVDGDDVYYVHLATWIGEAGRFPVRDVLFSDHVLPMLYWPPVSAFEGLAGALAWATGLDAPDVLYFAVPPVAAALAVLALRRLLGALGTPAVALALSAAVVFLLFAAQGNRTLGSFWIGRLWQGKVVLLVVLVPLLVALLVEYAHRPSRRGLVLLAAAGVAGCGLSTSGMFVVPVVAAGCLAVLAARALRPAAKAFAATAAYPLAAGLVTLALDGRQPDVYTDDQVQPLRFVHFVLGDGLPLAVALVAALAGPLLVRRRLAGRMVAGVALVVGLLLAPRVPLVLFHLTGLGQVLWRLLWAIPVAALVGVLAVAPAGRRLPLPVQLAPAAVLAAALVLTGVPLWSTEAGARGFAFPPAWKRPPAELAAARAVLRHARPGDLVLVPSGVGRSLVIASGRVTVLDPRPFYTRALGGRGRREIGPRRRLGRFATLGFRAPAGTPALRREQAQVRADVRRLGVDLACVKASRVSSLGTLRAAGLRHAAGRARQLECLRRAR